MWKKMFEPGHQSIKEKREYVSTVCFLDLMNMSRWLDCQHLATSVREKETKRRYDSALYMLFIA